MIRQKRLLDYIENFSPTEEKWMLETTETLPRKVTVSLTDGQLGILDMKDPRSSVWAAMMESLKRKKQPVYLEVDEESHIINNLLMPRVYKVLKIESDKHENIIVQLHPSYTLHGVLKSDPNSESMLVLLKEALNNGTDLLITETRYEHEIIDVRKPKKDGWGKSEPATNPPIKKKTDQLKFNSDSLCL